MSIALAPNEKPAPPIRRTPSMNTNNQHMNNNYLKMHLKCVQETMQSNSIDEFPPPPEYLLSQDSKADVSSSSTTTVQSSLLAEIQRGGFKLRRTLIERDRSAPRIR